MGNGLKAARVQPANLVADLELAFTLVERWHVAFDTDKLGMRRQGRAGHFRFTLDS